MTTARFPYRAAFPLWALLLWFAVGVSMWPAQAATPSALSSPVPVLVDDGDQSDLALPRDAGGQWQRRDGDNDPGWDPEPTPAILAAPTSVPASKAISLPATPAPAPGPRFPRSRQNAPRAPPL